MLKSTPLNTFVVALGVVFASSLASVPVANALANPFGMTAQSDSYMVAMDSTTPASASTDTAKANAMPEGRSDAGNMKTHSGRWCADKAEAGEGRCGMKILDSNGDGKITKEEFMQRHDEMFAKMDTNHDGVLDKNEAGKMMGGMHGKDKSCPRKDRPTK